MNPKTLFSFFPKWRTLARRALPFLLPATVFALWLYITGTTVTETNVNGETFETPLINPLFLPHPLTVLAGFGELWRDQLWLDFRISTITVLRGYVAGATIGFTTGAACGLSRNVESALAPTFNTLRQVPGLAWLPLLILWFGAGASGKTVLIGLAVFFPVFLNTLQAIRGVGHEYIEVGHIFGYGRLGLLRRIVLPAALPGIFVGLRYGAGVAWAVLVVAEMLGARRGLGFLLMRSQEMMHTNHLFVLIFLIGGVGFSLDYALRRVERHLLRWKRGFEG
ncbi:MAG: ABC transporter permease [Puniceicoccales bacterium]|jgi:sulfonate transport system permease protein|nr:ABC transporter permease [Puniceicoccales bacterium]